MCDIFVLNDKRELMEVEEESDDSAQANYGPQNRCVKWLFLWTLNASMVNLTFQQDLSTTELKGFFSLRYRFLGMTLVGRLNLHYAISKSLIAMTMGRKFDSQIHI